MYNNTIKLHSNTSQCQSRIIDDEWNDFISSSNNCNNSNYNNCDNDSDDNSEDGTNESHININTTNHQKDDTTDNKSIINKVSDIYISTKTIIAYLNITIDLYDIFWKIPIIPYSHPCDGVVKKQMKFNSLSEEAFNIIKENLQHEDYYEEFVITNINNPNGRVKFKDIRKISIGISKKDLVSYRRKKKSAFYNCFVLILRTFMDNTYKEYHVKVFNTGKLEIPGIQTEYAFKQIINMIVNILQPYYDKTIECDAKNTETVLINSNFNCGFYINREVLFDVLNSKYHIQSIYDPCSYPGIQCKFYYNPDVGIQTGSQISKENKELYKNVCEVSFMIFRTGSVLIVGKCDENVLMIIYEFLKELLVKEFNLIGQKFHYDINSVSEKNSEKLKKRKVMKKTIYVSSVSNASNASNEYIHIDKK
jgi:hypothetical protein